MSSQALAAGLSSFGSNIGQGFQNYIAGRERRELLSGEAMAYGGQLKEKQARGEKLSSNEEAMLKKLENVGDMGTRELQGIISEYETDEKMEKLQLQKRILQQQTEAAERAGKSQAALMKFHKDKPTMEEGFADPSFGEFKNVPAYLLDPAQRQLGDPVIPSYSELPSIEREYGPATLEMEKDVEKIITEMPPMPPTSKPMSQKKSERWLNEQLKIYGGEYEDAKKELEAHEAAGNFGYIEPIPLGEGVGAIIKSKIDNLAQDLYGDPNYQKSRELSRKLDRALERKQYLEKEIETNKYLPPLVIEGVEQEPVVSYDSSKVAANLAADENYYRKKRDEDYLNAIDNRVMAEGDRLGEKQVSGRFLEDEGDTPVERREKLIGALADYDLTPEDRKKAIDMISEKYPKLKEIATEVITSDGDQIGYNVKGSFVRTYNKGQENTPQGWRVKSRSVDGATGKVTLTYENPKNLPTYIPTAGKIAGEYSDLTLKNENAPSEGQAKEFNTAAANAKAIIADAKYLMEMTKDASFFEQRLTDRAFRADVETRIATMKGKLRPILIGPGAMSDIEQKMLANALPNPSDFFRLDSATIKRFETLGDLVDKKIKYHGEAIGLWDYDTKNPSKEESPTNPLSY